MKFLGCCCHGCALLLLLLLDERVANSHQQQSQSVDIPFTIPDSTMSATFDAVKSYCQNPGGSARTARGNKIARHMG